MGHPVHPNYTNLEFLTQDLYLFPLFRPQVEAVAFVVDVDVGAVALVDLAVDKLGGAALDLGCNSIDIFGMSPKHFLIMLGVL